MQIKVGSLGSALLEVVHSPSGFNSSDTVNGSKAWRVHVKNFAKACEQDESYVTRELLGLAGLFVHVIWDVERSVYEPGSHSLVKGLLDSIVVKKTTKVALALQHGGVDMRQVSLVTYWGQIVVIFVQALLRETRDLFSESEEDFAAKRWAPACVLRIADVVNTVTGFEKRLGMLKKLWRPVLKDMCTRVFVRVQVVVQLCSLLSLSTPLLLSEYSCTEVSMETLQDMAPFDFQSKYLTWPSGHHSLLDGVESMRRRAFGV